MHTTTFLLLLLVATANLASARTREGQAIRPVQQYPPCGSIRLIGYSGADQTGSEYYVYDMVNNRNTYYTPNYVAGHQTGNQADNYIGASGAIICGCCLTGTHVIAVNQHHDIDDRFSTDGIFLSVDCDYTHGTGYLTVGRGSNTAWNHNILSARYAGTLSSYSRIATLSSAMEHEGFDGLAKHVNETSHVNSTSLIKIGRAANANPNCGNGPSGPG